MYSYTITHIDFNNTDASLVMIWMNISILPRSSTHRSENDMISLCRSAYTYAAHMSIWAEWKRFSFRYNAKLLPANDDLSVKSLHVHQHQPYNFIFHFPFSRAHNCTKLSIASIHLLEFYYFIKVIAIAVWSCLENISFPYVLWLSGENVAVLILCHLDSTTINPTNKTNVGNNVFLWRLNLWCHKSTELLQATPIKINCFRHKIIFKIDIFRPIPLQCVQSQ